jgi:uncharacterized protein (TIGR03067 family)
LAALALLAAVGFAPAPLPRQQRQREDPTDVNGTWEFVLWESGGARSQGSEMMYNIEMTKEKYDFVGKNGGGISHYEMRLEPSWSPMAFSWSMNGRVMYVGSYRLKKGEMTMVFTYGNNLSQRPTDFDSRSVQFRFIMRRIKRGP